MKAALSMGPIWQPLVPNCGSQRKPATQFRFRGIVAWVGKHGVRESRALEPDPRRPSSAATRVSSTRWVQHAIAGW